MAKCLKRLHRVADQNMRERHGLRHNRAGGAIGKCCFDEPMPVGFGTLERKEQVPCPDFAGVERNAMDIKMSRSRPAGRGQQFFKSP